MDNAPYHSISINRTPNTSSKKDEISEWLKNKDVSFSPSETKSELLEIVLPFKSSEKMYELDQLANEMGHEVIRFPQKIRFINSSFSLNETQAYNNRYFCKNVL